MTFEIGDIVEKTDVYMSWGQMGDELEITGIEGGDLRYKNLTRIGSGMDGIENFKLIRKGGQKDMTKKQYVFVKDYPLGPISAGTVLSGLDGGSDYINMKINGKTTAVHKQYVMLQATLAPPATASTTSLGPSLSSTERTALDDLLNADSSFAVVPQANPEKHVAPKKPKPIKLEKNEFLLSEITGGVLPSSGKDVVMRRFPKGTWSKEEEQDIPEVDPEYHWNPDILEKMWLAYDLNENLLLTGFPGTGKSTAVRQFAAWVRQPLMKFNGKDGMEASSFLGTPWGGPAGKGMEWKDGLLPIAVRAGYLVTIDEVFKIPPGIGMALQELYEDGGALRLDDNPDPKTKVVKPHKHFRIFDTDNAKGTGDNFEKFSTTHVQDTARLDRYGITVSVPYMGKDEECQMLQSKFSDVSGDTISKIVRYAGLIRTGYSKSTLSLVLSPRGLQCACKLLQRGVDHEKALHMVYIDKLGDDNQVRAAQDLIGTAF